MELLTPLQPACMVSGAHSFILHISRIAGIAPISFEKVRGGWRIRVSWFSYAYSLLVVITLHTIIAFTVLDTREELVDGYEPSSNTGFMRIVTLVLGTVQLVAGLGIAITGPHRLRFVIDSMAHLEQIHTEFDLLFVSPTTSEIKTWLKIIILLLYGYVGSFMDYGIYMYDVIIANNTVPFAALSMTLTYFNVVHLQLLSMQFHMVVMNLVSTQQRLNNYLGKILDEYRKDSSASTLAWSSPKHIKYIEEFRIYMPTRTSYSFTNLCTPSTITGGINAITKRYYIPLNCLTFRPDCTGRGHRLTGFQFQFRGSKSSSEKVRQLINIYCLQCDIVRKLNDGHGIPIIMLLMYCAVYMVTSPYFVVTVLIRTHSKIPIFKIVSIFGYCSLCYAMIIVGTEPCHRSHTALKITKKLVNQIIRYTPREPSAVYYQIKMFRKHILLNPVSFSPLHLLKFDRNLSVAVLSAVITYLTVFMNL